MNNISKEARTLAALLWLVPVATLAAERIDAGLAGPALARQLAATGGSSAQSLQQIFRLDSRNTFRESRRRIDTLGNTHIRYQQLFDGIPVYGEQVITHDDGAGLVRQLTGKAIGQLGNDLSVADTRTQSITSERAMQMAKNRLDRFMPKTAVPSAAFRNERIELVIYLDQKDVARDVWSVSYVAEAPDAEPVRPYFLIDADDGRVLRSWNGMAHEAIGTGPGGNERIGMIEYGVDRPFLDVTKVSNTCTMNVPGIKTVNLNGGTGSTSTAYSYTCPRNTVKAINGAYSPLNDAHFFGAVTDEMFQNYFGRDPLDFQMVLRVHYGSKYENAFWDGTYTNFGDGKDYFYPMSTSLNVVAHEVAHGTTEHNSGLEYVGQSGGINESFSDIVGEAAEFYAYGAVDWLIGADVVKGKTKALRYFEKPSKDKGSINSAVDYYDGIDVHYSSGVFNRAYFLLANTAGWDPAKALRVFYHANVNYWTPMSNYVEAACGAISAAGDLGYDKAAVATAFNSVGVSCPLPPLDADGDFMDDNWETLHGLNTSSNDSAADPDGDGLSNLEEYFAGTDPNKADTDNDGIADAYDPLPNDSDWLGFLGYDSVVGRGDAAGARAGFSVASGDVDGDGFADIVVGAPYYDLKYQGKRYPDVGFAVVVSGKNGQVIWYDIGSWKGEQFGYAVAVVPDLDKDGISDVVVGLPGYELFSVAEGRYLKNTGAVVALNIAGSTAALVNSFVGSSAGNRFGSAVDGAGDRDVDGYRDIVVGAPGVDTQDMGTGKIYRDAGAVYVVEASSGQSVASYYNAGTKDNFGAAVAGVGDITGDGYQDVIAGAPLDDNAGKDAGSVFILTPVNNGYHNLYLTGLAPGDRFGTSVSSVGDVDKDGIKDFAVGFPYANKGAGGAAIFLGKGNTTQIGTLRQFSGAQPKAYMGAAVAGVKDVDGDGCNEILVGSPGAGVPDKVTGKTLAGAGVVQLFAGADGSELWSAVGRRAGDNFGSALASGDVNKDGAGDAVIGASRGDVDGGSIRQPKLAKDAGTVSVISGKAVSP